MTLVSLSAFPFHLRHQHLLASTTRTAHSANGACSAGRAHFHHHQVPNTGRRNGRDLQGPPGANFLGTLPAPYPFGINQHRRPLIGHRIQELRRQAFDRSTDPTPTTTPGPPSSKMRLATKLGTLAWSLEIVASRHALAQRIVENTASMDAVRGARRRDHWPYKGSEPPSAPPSESLVDCRCLSLQPTLLRS